MNKAKTTAGKRQAAVDKLYEERFARLEKLKVWSAIFTVTVWPGLTVLAWLFTDGLSTPLRIFLSLVLGYSGAKLVEKLIEPFLDKYVRGEDSRVNKRSER